MEVLLLLVVLVMYFVPTSVAVIVEHRNTPGIFVLNLFLGWTLVGWVAALVWAVARPAPSPAR